MGQPTGMIEMGVRGPNIANALSAATRDNLAVSNDARQNERLLLDKDANKRANHLIGLKDNEDSRASRRMTLSENQDKRATDQLYSAIAINQDANNRANGRYSNGEIDSELKSQLDGINNISKAMSSAYSNSVSNGVDEQTAQSNAVSEGYKIYKLSAENHNRRFPNSEPIPVSEEYYKTQVVPKAHSWYSMKMSKIQEMQKKEDIKTKGSNKRDDYALKNKKSLYDYKSGGKSGSKSKEKTAGENGKVSGYLPDGSSITIKLSELKTNWNRETLSEDGNSHDMTFKEYFNLFKSKDKSSNNKVGMSKLAREAMKRQGLYTAKDFSQGN